LVNFLIDRRAHGHALLRKKEDLGESRLD
jgi:hypothetical protein